MRETREGNEEKLRGTRMTRRDNGRKEGGKEGEKEGRRKELVIRVMEITYFIMCFGWEKVNHAKE